MSNAAPTGDESRVRPLVTLDRATIDEMCVPIAGGVPLGDVSSVDGGLVNTVLRVTTGSGAAYVLRVTARDEPNALLLMRRLAGLLPIPHVVVTGEVDGVPYMIYPWIRGITLNECRRTYGSSALASLAEWVGRAMGTVAAADKIVSRRRLPRLVSRDAIDTALDQLESDLVAVRLDANVRRALQKTFQAHRAVLEATDAWHSLVHGDFSGRNVIVREKSERVWTVSGLLDWETAAIGSPLWDVGSLFRYAGRYDAEFQRAFERGYRATGPDLPNAWWLLGRILDGTRLVGLLTDERELPSVLDDCRTILADLASPVSAS